MAVVAWLGQRTIDGYTYLVDLTGLVYLSLRELVTPGRQGITLALKNPVTTFSYVPAQHRLLIGCVGRYLQNDGGINSTGGKVDLDGILENIPRVDFRPMTGPVLPPKP